METLIPSIFFSILIPKDWSDTRNMEKEKEITAITYYCPANRARENLHDL